MSTNFKLPQFDPDGKTWHCLCGFTQVVYLNADGNIPVPEHQCPLEEVDRLTERVRALEARLRGIEMDLALLLKFEQSLSAEPRAMLDRMLDSVRAALDGDQRPAVPA